jgi:hypothetical protein
MGLRGVLWVWIMGSQNVMGSDYGSNISATLLYCAWNETCYYCSNLGPVDYISNAEVRMAKWGFFCRTLDWLTTTERQPTSVE